MFGKPRDEALKAAKKAVFSRKVRDVSVDGVYPVAALIEHNYFQEAGMLIDKGYDILHAGNPDYELFCVIRAISQKRDDPFIDKIIVRLREEYLHFNIESDKLITITMVKHYMYGYQMNAGYDVNSLIMNNMAEFLVAKGAFRDIYGEMLHELSFVDNPIKALFAIKSPSLTHDFMDGLYGRSRKAFVALLTNMNNDDIFGYSVYAVFNDIGNANVDIIIKLQEILRIIVTEIKDDIPKKLIWDMTAILTVFGIRKCYIKRKICITKEGSAEFDDQVEALLSSLKDFLKDNMLDDDTYYDFSRLFDTLLAYAYFTGIDRDRYEYSWQLEADAKVGEQDLLVFDELYILTEGRISCMECESIAVRWYSEGKLVGARDADVFAQNPNHYTAWFKKHDVCNR
ncbi:MAG: hypothetical protein IJ661_05800 [Lachnospiraceae bacterium]|nr:hypothetical protein [Lachnospiraceae bacterium]